jgi:UDP-glucose 4-epimerase
MRVLLTGTSGFIGRQLLPRLLQAGHEVRALIRQPESATRMGQSLSSLSSLLPPPSCEFVLGILPDVALCARLCAHSDAVIHTAGIAHVNASSADLHRVNFAATLELAQAARAAGVSRFLFLSSSKAAWPGHSAYAAGKAATEEALLALQVPGVFTVHCLRPALVYGPGMRGNLAVLLRLLQRRHLPLFVHANNPLGMISVDDLCRALLLALVAPALPGGVQDLSDGESYTLDQIVYHVRALLGLPPPRLYLPAALLRAAAAGAELFAPLYKTSLSLSTWYTLFAEPYRHDPAFTRLTGFQPQDSLLAQLPQLLEEFAR